MRNPWIPDTAIAVTVFLLAGGCNLFTPRDPEQPSQSSSDFRPPTTPEIVITNLQSAIAQKNSRNYISCFADPSRTGRTFSFTPSAEASAQYPSVLSSWSYADEQAYMQNLVSKAAPNGFSSLLLSLQSSVVSTDSVVYGYDYVFTFQHTETGFPNTASGRLQFTLGVDNSVWSIYRWVDFKTTADITWSSFKGRFSN